MQIASLPLGDREGPQWQITSGQIGADQKIPDWLIKIKGKTVMRLDIKSRFGIINVSTRDTTLGL